MTNAPDLHPTPASLSASLSAYVTATGASVVSIRTDRSQASGWIWKPGLIVTADEGLGEENEAAVTLPGGGRVAATIVGRDPSTDIALMRADTFDAPAVDVAGPAPATGELALAVAGREGRPLAAFGAAAFCGPAWRSMRGGEIDARIELDLSLRREAEGGLAVDARGRAFGMTVFGPRRRVLVIPGATLNRVAAQLETRGRVVRGYLGLGLQPVQADGGGETGAMVMSVDAGGPGHAAGVRQGDLILAWDGKPIDSLRHVLRSLGPASVGASVALLIRRGDDTRTVALVIGERPEP